MFSVVVADDEEIVREGFTTFIPWKELGFVVEKSFSNGQEVKDYLKTNSPDLVITDIDMPYMDGLTLAKWIFEHKPQCQVIILSAFQSFEFAQKAIRYNVKRYISKPIKVDEIKLLVKEVHKELLAQKRRSIKEQEKAEQFQETISFLQEQFLINLMTGYLASDQQVKKHAAFSHLPENILELPCIQFSLDLKERTQKIYLRKKVYSYVHTMQDTGCYPIFISDQQQFHLYMIGKWESLSPAVEKIAKNLKKLETDWLKTFQDAASFVKKITYEKVEDIKKYPIHCLKIFQIDRAEQRPILSEEEYLDTIIEKAIKYVREHFHKDISLEDVANQVYLTPVYFSRLFKKQTGITFIQHLTEIRMKEAKTLLATQQFKTYEVCERVGYSNTKYFSRVFKKHTGYAPKEYSRLIWKEKMAIE